MQMIIEPKGPMTKAERDHVRLKVLSALDAYYIRQLARAIGAYSETLTVPKMRLELLRRWDDAEGEIFRILDQLRG